MKRTLMIAALATASLGLTSAQSQTPLSYPETERDQTTDNYFGDIVSDPYRWLENDTTSQVKSWVDAQNAVTNKYLGTLPQRARLEERMTELLNYARTSAPFKKDGRYYTFRNDGLQNQSVLMVADKLNGDERVFLDPNQLSEDGTVALTNISFSKNGKYCAYGISRSGSDWNEFYVIDVKTGKLLDDHLTWVKFSGAEWDGNGFYYSTYKHSGDGTEFSQVNENHLIYYHKIGEPQEKDKLVYQRPEHPKRFYTASTSEDERFFFVFESGAGKGNGLYLRDKKNKNAGIRAIATDLDYTYAPIATIGDKIYIYTNYNAPRYRLMEASAKRPMIDDWKEVIGETENVLSGAQIIGGKIVATYTQDASTHIYVHELTGARIREIELPTVGSAGLSGRKEDKEAFLTFSSFTYPSTVFSYNMETAEMKLHESPKVNFNPDDFVTEQIFYLSTDGTRIPMSLVYKKGLKKDGNNPVFLYGYGGFNVSLPPSFSTNRIPFLEEGGIYAQMNLRGGGEYGDAWHAAGTKMQKQNVFDDCIAAAEYLIEEGYTRRGKLALVGGSNGGLLVGAVINQRPELFGAAIPQVGVMDMLRYHLFTIGWNWASDYGTSADSPEMYHYLKSYSPLHNIRPTHQYPAVLVTTADHDDRVVPAHSFKYAAQLQYALGKTNKKPLLIRIDSNAGHGSGKPITKVVAEQADIYAFIMQNLGM